MTTLKMTAPASPARTGVWVGIATITMSFAAYSSAMVVRQGSGADWQHVRLPSLLYVNTLVLLASSGTLELGRRQLRWSWLRAAADGGPEPGSVPQGIGWLYLTLALGLLFITGQLLAWRDLANQGLFLASTPNSAFFYVFTALHAVHLLGGVAALAYVLHRLRHAAGGPPEGALGAASLYWHFMDVLWVYLLLVLALRL